MADETKPMSGREPDVKQVVDLSGPDRLGKEVEIITPAGVIRVYAGLVTSWEGLPCVLVEVMPSNRYHPRSGDGGHWEHEVRTYSMPHHLDVSLVRKGDI